MVHGVTYFTEGVCFRMFFLNLPTQPGCQGWPWWPWYHLCTLLDLYQYYRMYVYQYHWCSLNWWICYQWGFPVNLLNIVITCRNKHHGFCKSNWSTLLFYHLITHFSSLWKRKKPGAFFLWVDEAGAVLKNVLWLNQVSNLLGDNLSPESLKCSQLYLFFFIWLWGWNF